MRKYGKANAAARMDDKGFYIILTICALAIVVSGYVLFFIPSGGDDQTVLEGGSTPSMPVTAPAPTLDLSGDEPLEEGGAGEAEAAAEETEVSSTPETEAAVETVGTAEPEESAAAAAEAPAPAPVWVRPVEGAVTIAFSGDELVFQPTFGDWRVHTGTDYAGDEGDRVYAVADGTVERVWNDGLYGQCVELAHADGLHTIYMGLKEDPKAKEGGTVKAGDVIGAVGAANASESAQGAHLHLEARVGDRPVDIETFLTGTEGE